MNAVSWFFLSAVLFSLGGYIALFAVTTYKALNAWVCAGFLAGALLDVLLILILVLKPT